MNARNLKARRKSSGGKALLAAIAVLAVAFSVLPRHYMNAERSPDGDTNKAAGANLAKKSPRQNVGSKVSNSNRAGYSTQTAIRSDAASPYHPAINLSPIESILKNSQDAGERIEAVHALSAIGGIEAARILEKVIEQDSDPYVRERAVFTLTEVSRRESLPLLKELASNDKDPNIRSAALANIELLKERYPEPDKGELQIEIIGLARVGGTLTIRARIASLVDVEQAKLFIAVPPGLELLSGSRGWKGRLMANRPREFAFDLRIKDRGRFAASISLRLSWDRFDYELIDKSIVIDTDTGEALVESSER